MRLNGLHDNYAMNQKLKNKFPRMDLRMFLRGGANQTLLQRGEVGVYKTQVYPRVKVTGSEQSPKCSFPEQGFKARELQLPFFEGSLPRCWPQAAGYTHTFLRILPMANPFVKTREVG